MKSETRNQKSESNSNEQKSEFGHWDFGFFFGFRISGFGFLLGVHSWIIPLLPSPNRTSPTSRRSSRGKRARGEAIADVSMTPERRLRWLLLENPNRAHDIPLGWRIRDDAGAVVGAAVCIPLRIGAGEFRTTALMFAKFFVDGEYRGMGLGIFMRFVREGTVPAVLHVDQRQVRRTIFAARRGGHRRHGSHDAWNPPARTADRRVDLPQDTPARDGKILVDARGDGAVAKVFAAAK